MKISTCLSFCLSTSSTAAKRCNKAVRTTAAPKQEATQQKVSKSKPRPCYDPVIIKQNSNRLQKDENCLFFLVFGTHFLRFVKIWIFP